jgi:hypothetical protein
MWRTFKTILINDKAIRAGLIMGLIVLLLQWVSVIGWAWRLPPEIPLYYSLPIGQLQLTGRLWFFILPVASLFFYLINLVIVAGSGSLNKVFPQVTTWLTDVSLALLLLAMVHSVMMVL